MFMFKCGTDTETVDTRRRQSDSEPSRRARSDSPKYGPLEGEGYNDTRGYGVFEDAKTDGKNNNISTFM